MIILLALLQVLPHAFAETECFVAEFDEVIGASGYFRMEISPSEAKYVYDFTLTNFQTNCDSSLGFLYHIHANWSNNYPYKASTVCAQAGGHYDPTLACPDFSSMVAECTQLGRRSYLGYHYDCTPSIFAQGNQYKCEIGDLSSKFGNMYGTINGNEATYSNTVIDPFPPTAINFNNRSGIATYWKSLVLHCPTDLSRILCAVFQPVACPASSSTSSKDVTLSEESFAGMVSGLVVGTAIICALAFYLISFRIVKRNSNSEEGLLPSRQSELSKTSSYK
jgi:hypothetical protein